MCKWDYLIWWFITSSTVALSSAELSNIPQLFVSVIRLTTLLSQFTHLVLISVVSRHSRWLFFNEKLLRAHFTLPAEQQKAGRQSQ